jgi:hypothetical protein
VKKMKTIATMGDLLSDANKGLDQPKLVLFRLEIDLDMPSWDLPSVQP